MHQLQIYTLNLITDLPGSVLVAVVAVDGGFVSGVLVLLGGLGVTA